MNDGWFLRVSGRESGTDLLLNSKGDFRQKLSPRRKKGMKSASGSVFHRHVRTLAALCADLVSFEDTHDVGMGDSGEEKSLVELLGCWRRGTTLKDLHCLQAKKSMPHEKDLGEGSFPKLVQDCVGLANDNAHTEALRHR